MDESKVVKVLGLAIAALGLLGAYVAARQIGAASDGNFVSMFVQPVSDNGGEILKEFNWLLFLLVAVPAVCTGALLFGMGVVLSAFRSDEESGSEGPPDHHEDDLGRDDERAASRSASGAE